MKVNWISIKDELPKKRGIYWVSFSYPDGDKIVHLDSFLVPDKEKPSFNHSYVEYWAKIEWPEPPEEEKNG